MLNYFLIIDWFLTATQDLAFNSYLFWDGDRSSSNDPHFLCL